MAKRTSSRQSAAAAMEPAVTDDPVLRFFKRLVAWGQEYWRPLVVLTVVLVVIVFVIVFNIESANYRAGVYWREFRNATKIADLEHLRKTHLERETEPYVLLRLIELYESDAEAPKPLKPHERIAETLKLIGEFQQKFGTRQEWKLQAGRLEVRKTVLERDKVVLEAADKREREPQTQGRPAPMVIKPETDAHGKLLPLKNPTAIIDLGDLGKLKLELFEDDAPNTVANFMFLVNAGFYDFDGPGGLISSNRSPNDPNRRMVGQFPNKPEADPDLRTPQAMMNPQRPKTTDPRFTRLNQKWSRVANLGKLGYTIAFEPGGTKRKTGPGTLVMKLEKSLKSNNVDRPDSASSSFFITQANDPDLDYRSVVFGQLDAESLNVLRRLPYNTPIQRAYVTAVRPGTRFRQVAKPKPDGTFEVIQTPDYVTVDPRGLLTSVFAPEAAQFVAVYPGQVEWIPQGAWYQDTDNTMKLAKDQPATLVHHAADELTTVLRYGQVVPPLGLDGARLLNLVGGVAYWGRAKLLPIGVVDQDEKGDPKPKTYRPVVKYEGYPTEQVAQDPQVVPEAAVTTNPFQPTTPAGGSGESGRVQPPGGSIPGFPDEFDPTRFTPSR